VTSDRVPKDIHRVIDAALEELAAEPGEAGRAVGWRSGWRDELAGDERSGPAPARAAALALVAVLTTAAAARSAWTNGHYAHRRSLTRSPRGVVPFSRN
jgi:hypothetical protein